MADGFLPQTSVKKERDHNNDLGHEAAETTEANLAKEPAHEPPPELKAKGVAGRKRKLRNQSRKAKAVCDPFTEVGSAIYAPIRQASTEDFQTALPMLKKMGLEVFANAEWGKGQGILKEYTRAVCEVGYNGPLSRLGTDREHLAQVWELPSGRLTARGMSKHTKWKAYFCDKGSRDGLRANEAENPVHQAVARVLAPMLHPNRPDIIPFFLANACAAEWRRIEREGQQSEVDWLGLLTHDLNYELIDKILPGSPTHAAPYIYQLARAQGLISDEDDEEEDRLDYEVQFAAVRDSILNHDDERELNVLNTVGLAAELAQEPEIPIEEGVGKNKAMTDDTRPKKKTKCQIDLSAASTGCEETPSLEVSESPSTSDHLTSSDVVYKPSFEATGDEKKIEEEFPDFKKWEAELATLSLKDRLTVSTMGFMGVCVKAAEMHRENMNLYEALGSQTPHDALHAVVMQKEQMEGLRGQIAETNLKSEEMEGLREQVADMNIKLKEMPDLRGQLAEKNIKLEEMEGLRGEVAGMNIKLKEMPDLRAQLAETNIKLEEMAGLRGQIAVLRLDNAKLESHIADLESDKKKALGEVVTSQAVVATTEENRRAMMGELWLTFLKAHNTLDDKLERTLEAIYRGSVHLTEEVTPEHKKLIAAQVQSLKVNFRDFTSLGQKLYKKGCEAGGSGSSASPLSRTSSASVAATTPATLFDLVCSEMGFGRM